MNINAKHLSSRAFLCQFCSRPRSPQTVCVMCGWSTLLLKMLAAPRPANIRRTHHRNTYGNQIIIWQIANQIKKFLNNKSSVLKNVYHNNTPATSDMLKNRIISVRDVRPAQIVSCDLWSLCDVCTCGRARQFFPLSATSRLDQLNEDKHCVRSAKRQPASKGIVSQRRRNWPERERNVRDIFVNSCRKWYV